MTISKELKTFLTNWLKWAENGAPEDEPYSRYYGLCCNAPGEVFLELLTVLGDDYPFGREEHDKRKVEKTQHLDPNRLAWVRATLEENSHERD